MNDEEMYDEELNDRVLACIALIAERLGDTDEVLKMPQRAGLVPDPITPEYGVSLVGPFIAVAAWIAQEAAEMGPGASPQQILSQVAAKFAHWSG